MAIANNKDLTHVVRTTQQWQSSYDKYECIPEGVLCIEFTTSGQALAKIGNGRDIFSKLPYIGGTDLTNYYTKSETAKCVEEIIKANRFIRIKGILQNKDRLPSNAECGDLYFVISQNQSSSNKYDEYVYSPSNTWENLGSIPIDIDLSEYAKIVYVDEKIDEVNERIDDIEQHGTHTHANKDILDLITAAFTAEEKDKLSTLYNYDDTELRELITQASHTHSNKDILDAISAPFTKEDKSKLDQLNPYDDSILKEKITALERLAHEHSNKRILDRTTASFTTEYERKMRWIRLYTGCTGMEEGIAGLVPAAQAGEEDYVLSGSGEWVPQTGGGGTYELPIASATVLGGIKVGDGLEIDANGKLSVVGGGGGDTITQGGGINVTTDPQTHEKIVSVNAGTGLEIDPQTGELYVTGGSGGDSITEGSGIDITTDPQTGVKTISVDIGNGLQFDSNDAIEVNTGDGLSINQDNELEVNVGDGLSINNNNEIELDKATTTTIGGVIVGDNLSIDNDGTISADEYTPGEGISIDSNKEVSVNYNSDGLSINDSDELELDKATKNSIGGVIVGDNIDVTDGTISVPIATDSSLGVVNPTDGLSIDNNGELSVNIGTGLEFDQVTGAINVIGGSGGDTVEAGDGIDIDTDSQTGNKVISVVTGDGLTVNQNNELEVNVGDGLTLDANDKITIDEDVVPLTHYFPGTAITFDQRSSAEVDIWNNGTGWANGAYTRSTGNSYLAGFNPEYHSPIGNNSLEVPTNVNRIRVIALSTNDDVLSVTVHCLDASHNRYLTLYDDTQPYDDWIDLDASTRYVNFGVRWTLNSNVGISATDIKSVTLYWQSSGSGDLDVNFMNINVNYGDGLTVNQDNELEVNIDAGDGIDITTESQTGNKVISIDTGNGLQINQDGELEIDPSIIPDAPQYYPGKAIDITASSDSNLPAGYAEVDYIEALGDSYTIIDYIPNRNTKIIGTAMMTDTSPDPVVFGARTSNNGQQFVFWFNRYSSTQATVGFVYGTNTWSTSTDANGGKLIPYVVGDQFTFLLSLEDEFNVNGEFVHNITENGAPASNIKLGIFALTISDTSIESSNNIFKGRMYKFKIYENDELVVNLVPAVYISTGSVGFYDTIGDTFYASRTSTPFICDPSTAHVSGYLVDVKYDNGLTVNSNNELEVVLSKGLEFDPTASETLVADELYLFNSRVTCQVHTDSPFTGFPPNRTYQKTTIEPALCCLWEVGGGDLMWTGPLIVGLTETAVQYTTQDTSQTVNYQNTFTYLGKTWYTSGYPDFLNDADHEDKLGHLQYLGSYSTTADQIQAAKDLIDLANVHFVSNAGIQAKLGNGLSFDANGAIQADAQPLSPATDSTLGGVIVGEGINVDEYGEISLSAGEGLDIDFESHIPSEYTLIKGISSVGHNDLPYINTGYLIKPTSRIVMRGVLYKTISGWAFPIGVRHNNYSNPMMFCTHHDHNGDSIELWLPNDTLIASATDREKCYNNPVTITISSDGLNIENETTGEVVTLTTSDTLPTATLPLYVFATNDNYTISFPGSMDLYRLQIFEGTTKVLDYLPCKRNSDNKYGVYDIVANEYKASSNAALFEPVTGTPSGDDLIQQIKLLPATENTIGGVIVGDGILVDNDGTISVDPTIIPEVTEYEAGTAISIEDVEHGGVTFDAWDSGTGWENICYSNSTGNSITSYQYEAHSPISNSYTLPAGATRIRAIAYNQNDTMLWTSFSWIDSNDYHFASTSPEDDHYDDWFEIPTGAVKVNFGVRHSKLNNTTAMSLNDIKSVDITIQTVSEIEVDVWNSGSGWLNGNYYSGTDPTFTTNWYYSYHSNPDAYIPIPNGATHLMVMGISNENDSHFAGGGVNVFSAESHSNHIAWWGCAWEWHEISSDAKFVQIDVKWNDNNTRTISGSDIKSVTLVWKLPALEINQAINVKYGDGLTVNQNNELEVNLGSGLQFDANGAIEVTGGGGGGDTIAEGDGISITDDIQTGDKVIAVNPGSGLQVNQTTNELEPKLGDGLELDEYNAITVDPFYPNTLILNCVLDDEPSSDLILHFTLDPDE